MCLLRTTFLVSLLACLALLPGESFADDPAVSQPTAKEDGSEPPLVLGGLDPVALVTGVRTSGRPERSMVYENYRYRFVSRENLEEFRTAPEKYAVQNRGVAVGFPGTQGDPDVFDVYQGRIYLFCTDDCRTIFRQDPAKWTKDKRRVGIFLYPGVELLDFAGPGEVFAAAAEGTEFGVFTIAKTSEPILSQGFLRVVPEYTIANSPQADILVIPGGHAQTVLDDPEVIRWLQQQSAEAEIVFSVCTGAFLLGKAGLLDGQQATTHWQLTDRLRQKFPQATVTDDSRVVDNGRIVTAAGVSAGIDGALHIVQRLLSAQVASETARYMEYNARPDQLKR